MNTPLSDRELEERFEEMLDDVYGTVKIAGLNYVTSHALKKVDPVAYRCGFNDWLDSAIGETLIEANGEYFDKHDYIEPEEEEEEEG